MKPYIRLMQSYIRLMKPDVRLMKPDVSLMKPDVRLMKPDVRLMKPDVRLLVSNIQFLKSNNHFYNTCNRSRTLFIHQRRNFSQLAATARRHLHHQAPLGNGRGWKIPHRERLKWGMFCMFDVAKRS